MSMRFRSAMVLWFVLAVLPVAGAAWAATITIVTPADLSCVESRYLNLVATFSESSSGLLRVAVGGQTYTRQITSGQQKSPVCFSVMLDNGLNRVDLSLLSGNRIIATSSVQVYLRSAVLKEYQHPPAGFKQYYFHLVENEALCGTCHRMEASLYDLRPARQEDSPCYSCHKNTVNAAYKHAPAAAGTCFSCHETVRGQRKYRTSKPDRVTCFVCHSAQNKLWSNKRVHHGPTAVGNCTLCHDPHGSQWPAFVRMHPTDLCLNCHHDKKSGLHVIAGFFAKGHPVRAAVDPIKRDRSFSCASCHNPHAGDTQNLLNGKRDNQASYCQSCHKL